MNRLYPNRKVFVDNSEPDLDAEYFNGVETALSAMDERMVNFLVATLTSTVAGQKALDAVVGRILNEKITANAAAIATLNSNMFPVKGGVENPLYDTLGTGIYTYPQNAPNAPSSLQGIVLSVKYHVWVFALAIDYSGKLFTAVTNTADGIWGIWTEK